MAFQKADEEELLVELLEDQRGRLQGLLEALAAAGAEKAGLDGGMESSLWQNVVERFVGPEP